jgi:hypothetical protein
MPMKVEFLPKGSEQNNFLGPSDDWIRMTDFCQRAVYFYPSEAVEVIAAIQKAAGIVSLEVPFQRIKVAPDETLALFFKGHISEQAHANLRRSASEIFDVGENRIAIFEEGVELAAVKVEK